MKYLPLLRSAFLLMMLSAVLPGKAQYYYKDIVVTDQAQKNLNILKRNKVRKITLQSLEKDGEPTPGFVCTQTCSQDYKILTTYTTTSSIPPSTLTAFYDKSGRLIKTSDSSERYVSTTTYDYNSAGQISAVRNAALETDNKSQTTEDHLWTYQNGLAAVMKKIKNGTDTTSVTFKNESGNVTEELAVHGPERQPAVYYYYDSAGAITDIVRYNVKAQRLLPDYIFTYDGGRLRWMIFVPSGSSNYENWQYDYDQNNLKVRDICRNKQRETVAMVRYTYSLQ